MKDTIKWMLAAILTFCGAMMTLSSCNKKTDLNDLYGLYYNEYDATGSIASLGEYNHVLQAVRLNSDGTGTWWKFFFSPNNTVRPLYLDGGTIPVDGSFTYTVSDDGVVTATRNGDVDFNETFPKTLVFSYDKGTLTDSQGRVLTKASEEYFNTLEQLENSMLGSDEGELSGLFSVGNGKKVHFSMGNLQWSGTQGWRFAERQYDCIGNQANNNTPTAFNENYLEFFCWGATGLNGIAPNTMETFLQGPVNLTGNNDWGGNPIKNGGNVAGRWRSLTYEEWQYLFEGGTKYGYAKVAGMAGIILLPDDFVDPMTSYDDQAFKTANEMGYDADYENNSYPAGESWTMMENAGAVFLPAAGTRYDSTVAMVGMVGMYWTASFYDSDWSYYIDILSGNILLRDLHRSSALSVRLVKDVN